MKDYWRDRCASCRWYREEMAVGVGCGICTRDGTGTSELDGCEHHKAPEPAR